MPHTTPPQVPSTVLPLLPLTTGSPYQAFLQREITPETTVWYFYPDIYTSINPFKKCTGFEGTSAFSLHFPLLSLALLYPISRYFKGISRLLFIFSADPK